MRTNNGQIYSTYQEACLALGIMQDDAEWIQCFEEAVIFTMGSGLCTLFATVVMHSGVVDPNHIWT